ncbi:unnamed protein product [Amoebophrya sp. A25]|nr:unnamed protein product [Amoebophrya sp. A25]|eukprot:GSA25T00019835001.1
MATLSTSNSKKARSFRELQGGGTHLHLPNKMLSSCCLFMFLLMQTARVAKAEENLMEMLLKGLGEGMEDMLKDADVAGLEDMLKDADVANEKKEDQKDLGRRDAKRKKQKHRFGSMDPMYEGGSSRTELKFGPDGFSIGPTMHFDKEQTKRRGENYAGRKIPKKNRITVRADLDLGDFIMRNGDDEETQTRSASSSRSSSRGGGNQKNASEEKPTPTAGGAGRTGTNTDGQDQDEKMADSLFDEKRDGEYDIAELVKSLSYKDEDPEAPGSLMSLYRKFEKTLKDDQEWRSRREKGKKKMNTKKTKEAKGKKTSTSEDKAEEDFDWMNIIDDIFGPSKNGTTKEKSTSTDDGSSDDVGDMMRQIYGHYLKETQGIDAETDNKDSIGADDDMKELIDKIWGPESGKNHPSQYWNLELQGKTSSSNSNERKATTSADDKEEKKKNKSTSTKSDNYKKKGPKKVSRTKNKNAKNKNKKAEKEQQSSKAPKDAGFFRNMMKYAVESTVGFFNEDSSDSQEEVEEDDDDTTQGQGQGQGQYRGGEEEEEQSSEGAAEEEDFDAVWEELLEMGFKAGQKMGFKYAKDIQKRVSSSVFDVMVNTLKDVNANEQQKKKNKGGGDSAEDEDEDVKEPRKQKTKKMSAKNDVVNKKVFREEKENNKIFIEDHEAPARVILHQDHQDDDSTSSTSASDFSDWDTTPGYDFLLRDVNRCDWERIDVTSSAFRPQHLDWSKPMMFTNWHMNAELQERTRKENMLQEFGNKTVILSNAVTYSHEKKRCSFAEYVEDFSIANLASLQSALSRNATDTWYLCGDNFWDELLNMYVRPEWLPGAASGSLAFGVGGTGSGIPLHRHGGALLEVTAGRKRWFVAPPSSSPSSSDTGVNTLGANKHKKTSSTSSSNYNKNIKKKNKERGSKMADDLFGLDELKAELQKFATSSKPIGAITTADLMADNSPPFDPEKSSFNWFHDREDENPQSRIRMCTQETNEALWLPNEWWHATLNIGETVFWLLFV